MKTCLIIVNLILYWNISSGQISNADTGRHIVWYEPFQDSRLDSVGQRLASGDKQALVQLASYLDSTRFMAERLGFERYQEQQKDIAKEIIYENCLFLPNELDSAMLTSSGFLAFLYSKWDKIIFNTDVGEFLITPLQDRDVKFELRELSGYKKVELKNNEKKLLTAKGVYAANVARLVNEQNPLALLKIASALYHSRNGYDSTFNLSDEHCIALLEVLTGTEICVENGDRQITAFTAGDYTNISRLNLLIYFAKYYRDYKWYNASGVFRETVATIKHIDRETTCFDKLSSKDNRVAMDAFVKLTTCNHEKVSRLADDYKNSHTSTNKSITPFPYDFLKRIPVLTAYCKANSVNFSGSKMLRQNIARLKQRDLTFAQRRKLEDQIVITLPLNEVTALEYWRIIYAENSHLNYSVARILDIFYSKNWRYIIHNKKQLDLYLKKSLLLDSLWGHCL